MSARLFVLAHGLSVALKDQIGIARVVTSACHSITLAFDIKPRHGAFDFSALTYYPERTADRLAYLTLFPVRTSTRANLMVYRNMDDPWLRDMRHDPERSLFALMPNLRPAYGRHRNHRTDQDTVGRPLRQQRLSTSRHRRPGRRRVRNIMSGRRNRHTQAVQ
jgi:hypothetical protein